MSIERPKFLGYWAQDAATVDIGDADVYIPSNPVYPEQVANQYEAGWFVSIDGDVKQPHQWVNKWLQDKDYIIHAWHVNMSTWLPEVEYLAGAVVNLNNKRYIAQSASAGINPETASTQYWEEVAFYTKAQGEADLKEHTDTFNAHFTNYSNPHAVHVHQINGYTKAEIDSLVAGQASGLAGHVARVDNPHEVTAAQLGILPITGGTHTGNTDVGSMQFRSGQEVRKHGDSIHLLQNGHTLGVDDLGVSRLDGHVLLDEANHNAVRQRNSEPFKVTSPDWHLPLVADINCYPSTFGAIEYLSSQEFQYVDKTGTTSTARVDVPAFTAEGLAINAASVQQLKVAVLAKPATLVANVNGVVRKYQGNMSSQNLLDYFVEFNPTAIKDLKLWYGTLTSYQLKALGVNT